MREVGRHTRLLITMATGLTAVALLIAPASIASAAPLAKPVTDCNTPNGSGGTGIIETPANNNTSAQQYLTKTGTGYNAGGTSYNFTVTSRHSPAATFSELTDCAYSTINGDPSTATYNENISPINFTYNANTATWTASFSQSVSLQTNGQPDNICDRVQLKGTDGSAFTDYSNMVTSTPSGSTSLAGSATSCAPTTNVPEVPATGLIAIAGLGLAGAAAVTWRRRDHTVAGAS